VSRGLVNALPAALVPSVALCAVASRGVFPAPLAVAVTAIVLAVLAVAELRRGVRLSSPALWLAGLVAWAALATMLRPVDRVDAASFVAVGGVALVLAVLAAGARVAAWGRLAVVVAGGLTAAWLVAERLTGGGRPGGPFENPNVAATVAVIALALVPLLRSRPATRASLAVLLVAGVVVSTSRAGLLAAVAVGLVWAVSGARRELRVVVALVVCAAALGLAWRFATDRDPLRFERIRIWLVAVRTAVAELPAGCGPAGFEDAAIPHNFARAGELARYARVPSLAESDALELLATLGVPGLVLGGGLVLSVARAAGGSARALAPCLAVAITSAVHTQLSLPAVAWTATLAVAGTLRRTRSRGLRVPGGVAAAGACAAAAAAAYALGVLDDRPQTAARLLHGASAALAPGQSIDRLADAEAVTWRACMQRPRWSAAWAQLGELRLERAQRSGDAILAGDAVAAFAAARRANPLAVWAALGEGQARRALGERRAAAGALEAAVRLEPHCAPAWVELALLRLDDGEVAAARAALASAEASLAFARGRVLVSDYERAMVTVDRVTLAWLRARCGVRR
jgi:hypothetical protein